MYELIKDLSTDTRRCYRSKITNTDIFTNLIYTDGANLKWWAFEDLLQIPYMRKQASSHISQLFGQGFTQQDFKLFTDGIKTLVKSNDPEKMDKIIASCLNTEDLFSKTADPVKEHLAMCTVYILADDERVDFWTMNEYTEKVNRWEVDVSAMTFFLHWLQGSINSFTAAYNSISEIVSIIQKPEQ